MLINYDCKYRKQTQLLKRKRGGVNGWLEKETLVVMKLKIWLDSGGKKVLKELASELNVSDSQIRKWKSVDKWADKLKVTLLNRIVTLPIKVERRQVIKMLRGTKEVLLLKVIRTLLKLANTKQYLPICYLTKKRTSILI